MSLEDYLSAKMYPRACFAMFLFLRMFLLTSLLQPAKEKCRAIIKNMSRYPVVRAGLGTIIGVMDCATQERFLPTLMILRIDFLLQPTFS